MEKTLARGERGGEGREERGEERREEWNELVPGRENVSESSS